MRRLGNPTHAPDWQLPPRVRRGRALGVDLLVVVVVVAAALLCLLALIVNPFIDLG